MRKRSFFVLSHTWCGELLKISIIEGILIDGATTRVPLARRCRISGGLSGQGGGDWSRKSPRCLDRGSKPGVHCLHAAVEDGERTSDGRKG